MANKDGQLKEFELLRQELLQHDRAILQVVGLILGFIGIITAQGLTSGNPYVFLIPFPVLTGLSKYISDKRWAIWLIASYIMQFIEDSELGPRWETQLYFFRTACKKHGFTPGQNIIKVECWFLNILGLIEYGLFVYFAQTKGVSFWQYLVPLPFGIWLIWQTTSQYFRLAREGRDGSNICRLWKEADQLRQKKEQ